MELPSFFSRVMCQPRVRNLIPKACKHHMSIVVLFAFFQTASPVAVAKHVRAFLHDQVSNTTPVRCEQPHATQVKRNVVLSEYEQFFPF